MAETGEREGETRDIILLIMGKMTDDMNFLERLSIELGDSDTKIINNIQGLFIINLKQYEHNTRSLPY